MGKKGKQKQLAATVEPSVFDPDRPRAVGADDPLRRERWIQVLETQLQRIPITDSFVFSLEGPWGSGKTSVLDTIEADLTAQGVLVLRFNPWLFAGAPDLVGSFFRELAAQLKERASRFGKLSNVFGGLASALGGVGAVVGGPAFAAMQVIAKGSSEALGQAAALHEIPSLLQTKRKLGAELAATKTRLIVLVDDLERLTAREALDVLRAVRVIADLPGLIYVLAFDREQLVRSLVRAGEDPDFLDKIVQIPVRLPSPPVDALRSVLFAKLDTLLTQLERKELDGIRWSEVAREIVFPLIKTPRDAVRLANAVAAALAHLGDRVALEDVIAMEALRLAESDLFEGVRIRRAVLTVGDDTQVEVQRSLAKHTRTRAQQRDGLDEGNGTGHRDALDSLAQDKSVCAAALQHLFPALEDLEPNAMASTIFSSFAVRVGLR